jgi:hypothetical protein
MHPPNNNSTNTQTYDINKLLASEQLTIPKTIYTLNNNEKDKDSKRKSKSSKVEKNIDILKLLENSSNTKMQEKVSLNILDQLDTKIKNVSTKNKRY